MINRVRTSSEITKSRVFHGCFSVFSRAFPGRFLKPGIKIIKFTMNCLKQHLRLNVITVKQQCAPKCIVFNTEQWFLTQNEDFKMIRKSTISTITCNEILKNAPFCKFIFSIKFCEILQGLIKKFQGFSRGFQGFPGLQKISRVFQDF